MSVGVGTNIEKYIRKLVYPSGVVRYRVEFFGKFPFYEMTTSLEKAKELKAAHLKKHPEILPLTSAERKAADLERAKTTKVPGTKFIHEYQTRPGTYHIRIARTPKLGETKIEIVRTVVGLENAKKTEKELIKEVEKRTGRGIDDVVPRPPKPEYAEAVADVRKQMKKWNKLGYFPDNMLIKLSDKYNLPYVKGQGGNAQLGRYVMKTGLVDRTKLTALSSKYIDVVEKWKNYKGDKTKVGVKRALLEGAGLPSKSGDVGKFGSVLRWLKINVPEILKLPGERKQRNITKALSKVSALNIESFLTGRKLGPLQITGKQGSLIDKMHLAEKRGLITVGEMGYGSAKLNQMLGAGFVGKNTPEKHRVALNNHIDRIVKKYKGNPDAMYEISKGPDSFDQRKFKNSLQKIFGKTQGKVPLAKYLDQIINTEVQLMGYATDGLITTRRVDPITLERMIPPSSLAEGRTLTPVGKIKDLTTLQELGLEKKQAGPTRVTPRLRDFNVSATLAFEDAKINIAEFKNRLNPYQMKSVVKSIDKMLGEGLQNQAYENISKLSKQCRLLRAKGGRVDFAQGGPCVSAKRAIQNLDNGEFIKIGSKIEEGATGVLGKIKNVSGRFLSLLGRGGVRAAPYAALAAVGAGIEPLVRQFRNDDPSTYLTDESQMKGMLLATIEGETPKVDEEILKWQLPGTVAGAATAVPGSKALFKARTSGIGKAAMGIPRAGLGPLMKILGGTFSPLAVAATLPVHIAAQRAGGTDYGDIATDPMNWMGPAFASTGADLATRGMKGSPRLANAIRLGFSPKTLSMFTRRFGLPGLAVSAGLWGYDKWKNRSINDE